MTDTRLDASLLSQLDTLRERALALLEDGERVSPALLRVAQGLDRLSLQAHADEIDDITLSESLSMLAGQLEDAARAPASVSDSTRERASLLRETVPSSAAVTLQARNQARLVEHALSHATSGSGIAQDAIEDALVAFATAQQRSGQPGALSEAGAMQRRLSRAVDARVHAMLVRREALEGALPSTVSELERGALTPATVSSGDLRGDLLSLVASMDQRRASRLALEGQEMTLARVESDASGAVQRVQARQVETAPVAPAAPTAVEPAAAAAPRAPEVVVDAVATHGELESARAQLAALQRVLQDERESTEARRAQAERLSERVAVLQTEALAARQRLDAARAARDDHASIDQLVASTRSAARGVLARSLRAMGQVATSYGDALRAAASSGDTARVARTRELLPQLSAVATRLETLDTSSSPADIADAAADLESLFQDGRATGDTEILAAQTRQLSERAVSAAHGAAFVLPVPSSTGEQSADVQAVESARSASAMLDRQLSRYEQLAYGVDALQERVLTVEADVSPEALPARTRREAVRPVRLAAPSAVSTVQVDRIDRAELHAEAERQLREIRGLESLRDADAVELYAESAGLELTHAARRAVRSGEAATLASEVIARATDSLRRELSRQAGARLARSAGRVSTTPSGARELGLPTSAHFELQSGTRAPLFKRKMGVSAGEGASLLPALYTVAGFGRDTSGSKRGAPVRSGMMLRKALDNEPGVDLTGGNLDVIHAIESAFGNMGPHGSRLGDYGTSPTQEESHMKSIGSALEQATASVSEWMANRNMSLATVNSTSVQDQIETGKIGAPQVVSGLNSEGMQIPTRVKSRLAPLLGGDIGDVKVYAGSFSAMAAATFGAKAFTIGKHIFFDPSQLNWDSTEGLSLLAHELIHTQHFSEGSSVEEKEKEAEAMEARVRKAFGGAGGGELALEAITGDGGGSGGASAGGTSTPTPSSKERNQFAAHEPLGPGKGGFRPAYDPEIMLKTVYDMVVDWIANSAKRERLRRSMT